MTTDLINQISKIAAELSIKANKTGQVQERIIEDYYSEMTKEGKYVGYTSVKGITIRVEPARNEIREELNDEQGDT